MRKKIRIKKLQSQYEVLQNNMTVHKMLISFMW